MRTLLLLLLTMAIAVPAAGDGGPDPENSSVDWEYAGTETLSLCNRPDGGGMALNQARLPGGGGFVDATIILTLRDYGGYPIAAFPSEDMWLESSDGGMTFCFGGTTADTYTDVHGETRWSSPLQAGRWSTGHLQVMVNGFPILDGALDMQVNSPDITGDLRVDLADVTAFAIDFFGAYHYRSDFNYDSVLNLIDVGLLAEGLGSTCP